MTLIAEPEVTEEVDYTPIYIGPTWQKNEDGTWKLPEKTLGWQVAGWMSKYLLSPDGSGEPYRLTLEQLRMLLWIYALNDDGTWLYKFIIIQRCKGAGKDPLAAALSLAEMAGPCRFGGWDADGEPIAIECNNAWVTLAAVSQEQTQNTMTLMPTIMSDAFIAKYGVNHGATHVRCLSGRRRIQSSTTSPKSVEGKRTTFAVLNEIQWWDQSNGGHKMFEVIDGNVGKIEGARWVAICNAFIPGEDSVLERIRTAEEDVWEGRAVDIGRMYDSIEANPSTPLTPEALEEVIPLIRGDATWLKAEQIIPRVLNTAASVSEARRKYLNQVVADAETLVPPLIWQEMGDPHLRPLESGDEVVLGFDGGKTDDSTALVAIRVCDRSMHILGLWEKRETNNTDEKWVIDRSAVDSAVHDAFLRFNVKAFFADVAYWESYVVEWTRLYGPNLVGRATQSEPIAWDMRASLMKSTQIHERFLTTLFDRTLKHNGDPHGALRRHFLNVKRRTNNYGVYFGKETRESKKKIDLYAAMMLAHEALVRYQNHGKEQKIRTGNGWFM